MRAIGWFAVLGLPLLTGGCWGEVTGITAAIAGATVPVIQRSPLDALVSAASGRDCSIVYLDQRSTYCRPKERPPEPPEFCTRSLGVVDCWADPSKLPPNHPPVVADGPRALTPEQEDNRTRRWPGLW